MVSLIAVVLPAESAQILIFLWSVAAIVALAIRSRQLSGHARWVFGMLSLTAVLMVTGAATRSVHGQAIGVAQPFPSYADLLHVPGYLLVPFVFYRVLRIRAGQRDVDAWLDAIALVGAALLVFWVAFLSDFATSGAPTLEVGLSVFYNAMVFLCLLYTSDAADE